MSLLNTMAPSNVLQARDSIWRSLDRAFMCAAVLGSRRLANESAYRRDGRGCHVSGA